MKYAKQLFPDLDSFGQCEAQREGRYLSDTPQTNMRCAHSAKYEVAGKKLCSRHAGVAALRVLCDMPSVMDTFAAMAADENNADPPLSQAHVDALLKGVTGEQE